MTNKDQILAKARSYGYEFSDWIDALHWGQAKWIRTHFPGISSVFTPTYNDWVLRDGVYLAVYDDEPLDYVGKSDDNSSGISGRLCDHFGAHSALVLRHIYHYQVSICRAPTEHVQALENFMRQELNP